MTPEAGRILVTLFVVWRDFLQFAAGRVAIVIAHFPFKKPAPSKTNAWFT